MNVIEVKDVSFQSSAFSINNLSFSIPQICNWIHWG